MYQFPYPHLLQNSTPHFIYNCKNEFRYLPNLFHLDSNLYRLYFQFLEYKYRIRLFATGSYPRPLMNTEEEATTGTHKKWGSGRYGCGRWSITTNVTCDIYIEMGFFLHLKIQIHLAKTCSLRIHSMYKFPKFQMHRL